MKLFRLFHVLCQIGLFSPVACFRLLYSICTYGINLMALLAFSAKMYRDNIGLKDERESLTYHQLFVQSEKLGVLLGEQFQLGSGKKVGVICKNHASLVKAIFAVSWTGADLYLLNVDMGQIQLNNILARHAFDLLIHDEERSEMVQHSSFSGATVYSYHHTLPAINNFLFSSMRVIQRRRMTSSGRLVLLTGGTTGNVKEAAHYPSLFHYLDPFCAFVTRLNVLHRHTAYIATPIYHGYGVAVLLLFCALGKKIVIQSGFDAQKACRLIREQQVDVVTVVPLMLQRMLQTSPFDLKSLKCIASGGAEINSKLVKETVNQLGGVLYNLYGTSEAGLITIATPDDLNCALHTIGRKIKGVRLQILDENKQEVECGRIGQLCIKNRWSWRKRAADWIETGDLGYRDRQGYYFLCGRADSMIVSGGENVYPFEVEQILLTHPQVDDVGVIGVPDEHYGQRLKAFVVLVPDTDTTRGELVQWLHAQLARYQMPKEIIFVDRLPYTSLGKKDKKLLSRSAYSSSSFWRR
ncbi:AMP-binding protein [Brevibacillus migulae]|uniref:AMP-binding protein n=1 Tax=Brevibacillus migulae TaxID=1644114 RepID=UPI00196B9EBE|nr:AMP-binding protein [Brevibacillus migulae]